MAGIRSGWLTIGEAGIVIGVSRWTVRTLVRHGLLAKKSQGGRAYVSFDGAERLLMIERILRRARRKTTGKRRR